MSLAAQQRALLFQAWDAIRHTLVSLEGTPSDSHVERAITVGFICDIVRSNHFHAQLSLGTLMRKVDSAIQTNQLKLYFSHYGDCVGYIAWAFLTPDVERRMLNSKDMSLPTEEWTQGTSLWIIDFLVPSGSLSYVLRDMRDNLFKNYDTITYFRFKNGRRIAKQWSRTDRGGFFARGA